METDQTLYHYGFMLIVTFLAFLLEIMLHLLKKLSNARNINRCDSQIHRTVRNSSGNS